MYLLYLDESGNENAPGDRFFVLGGLALFERQTFFLTQKIEEIQRRYFPDRPLPIHASEIRTGRNFWRNVPKEIRTAFLLEVAQAIQDSPARGRALFAAVVEKTPTTLGDQVVEKATEEICRRFDLFLQRRFHRAKDPQRGLLIFSEGRFDPRAKIWVRDFHQRGTRWGAIRNLADIPYFAPARESRLLQLADFVAHATWLLFERRDPSLFRSIAPCFDQQSDRLHGLVHVRLESAKAGSPCECPACFPRSRLKSFGPWLETTHEEPGSIPF